MTNISEIKFKQFQCKLNNTILVTNSFLLKIDTVDSDLCSYCNEVPETIIHIFFECEVTKQITKAVKTGLAQTANNIKRDEIFHIFYKRENTMCTFSFFSLLLQYYIYKTKFKECGRTLLNISLFKNYVKQKSIYCLLTTATTFF